MFSILGLSTIILTPYFFHSPTFISVSIALSGSEPHPTSSNRLPQPTGVSHSRTRHHITQLSQTQPTQTITRPTQPTPSIIPIHTQIPHTSPSRHFGQKPIFIVFEILAGLLASGLLLCCGRCCYQYKRAPKRDRIAEVLNRHNLQREMAGLELSPQILRRASLREPAPPYYPAPPSYEIITSSPNYTDTGTPNLPSSPSPQPSNLIPPRPPG